MINMADDENLIKVVVKTTNTKETIEIEPNATIGEFKGKISPKFNGTPIAQLCLIFAGKILKDEDSLEHYGIKDGLTVHLVIKSANKAQQQAAQHATRQPESSGTSTQPSSNSRTPTSTTTPPPPFGGLPSGMGMGNG